MVSNLLASQALATSLIVLPKIFIFHYLVLHSCFHAQAVVNAPGFLEPAWNY